MTGPISKAELMRNTRLRRKKAGLIKVISYVTSEEDKQRLANYVVKTLKGECPVKDKT